jgi:hypothetical protein
MRNVELIPVHDSQTPFLLPLFSCSVSAGFPSPASDYTDELFDLNRLLLRHPDATYLVRVSGESMKNAKFRAWRHLLQTEAEQYDALQATAKPLAIAPLIAARPALPGDSARVNRAWRFTRALSKDLTLTEAVAVLRDAQ